jgi:UDP-glucose 4-epimerase
MSAERILITGVAGFIGSHVARRFLAEGYAVVGVDDMSEGKPANVPAGVDFVQADLGVRANLERLPRDCRSILHLAGQSSGEVSFDDPVSDLEKNTVSTLNLIRFGIATRAERLVYASSMSVYGAVPDAPIPETHPCLPLSCYGVGKYASENYLRIYGKQLPSVAMRMFNVYGPGQDMSNLRQGMVSIFLAQALNGGRILVKGGTQRFRDLIYIDDVVEAWFRAATRATALGQVLNIGTGVRTTVGDLLARICAHVPGATFETQGGTPGDQSGIYADNTQLRRCLGIDHFVPFDSGLPRFVAWAREAANNRMGAKQTS